MKVILAILLLLSLAGNLYLGVLLVDAGIIVDNAQTVAENLWDRRQLALDIMKRDWVGRSASEVDALAEELGKEGVLTGTEGERREVGSIVFHVEGGVVVDVEDRDSKVEVVR